MYMALTGSSLRGADLVTYGLSRTFIERGRPIERLSRSLAGVRVRGGDEEPPSSSAGRGETSRAGDDAAAASGHGVAVAVRRGESAVQPLFPRGRVGGGHAASSARGQLSVRAGDVSSHLRERGGRDAAAGVAQRGGGGEAVAARRAEARLPAVRGGRGGER